MECVCRYVCEYALDTYRPDMYPIRMLIRIGICIGYVSSRYVSDANEYSYWDIHPIHIGPIRIRCECLFVLGYQSNTYRDMYLIHIGTIRIPWLPTSAGDSLRVGSTSTVELSST